MLTNQRVSWASETRKPPSHKTSFTFPEVEASKDTPSEGTHALAHSSCPSSPVPAGPAEVAWIQPSHKGLWQHATVTHKQSDLGHVT